MTHGLRIARVDLRVADVRRSEAFYGRITGLEARDGALLDRRGRPLVTFSSAGVRPVPALRAAAGLFHIALRVDTREALGAALRRVRDALTGASDHGVSEALYVRDPDNLGVELYWDRPRERWPSRMVSGPLDPDDLASLPETTGSWDVGHVHLAASDLEASERFWAGVVGLRRTDAVHDQARFLAADEYHHHIGLNVWESRGRPPQARDRPRLERIVLEVAEGPVGRHATPEGVELEVAAAGPA